MLLPQKQEEILNWLVLIVFSVLMLLTGIYFSQKEKELSSENLLLARRQLPLWLAALTMGATWIGGGFINGSAEAAYSRGLAWAQAPWAYALSLALGGIFFVRPMFKAGYRTLLDPFSKKYGERFTALLFIPAVLGDICWTAAILSALGYTAQVLLGIDFIPTIIAASIITILYTYRGGLKAVAYTDVLQLSCLVIGLVIATPFIIKASGGLENVLKLYSQHFENNAQFWPPAEAWQGLILSPAPSWGYQIWLWLDYSILLGLGGIPWGVYFQRVFACRNARQAQNLSYIAGAMCITIAIPALLIGMAAISYFGPNTTEAALILPQMLQQATPPWVATLGLIALMSAVMSSTDSSILSAATLFTFHIYKPCKPQASPKHILKISRLSIITCGALASILAIKVGSVYTLWSLSADLVFVLLFPQLVLVLWDRRSNLVGASSAFATGLFLRLGGGESSLGIANWLPYPGQDPELGLLFPVRTFAMLSSLLCGALVSRAWAFYKLSPEKQTSTNAVSQ